jgi:hypothetical protein
MESPLKDKTYDQNDDMEFTPDHNAMPMEDGKTEQDDPLSSDEETDHTGFGEAVRPDFIDNNGDLIKDSDSDFDRSDDETPHKMPTP